MKRIIIITITLFTLLSGVAAQNTAGEYRRKFVTNKKDYIDKSVADFLRDVGMPVNSFVVNPNYNNPDYGNEFRFTNYDVNATSTIIHANQTPSGSGELFIFYIKFKPQLKYPTTGFINANREKPLLPDQYAEFEKYKIVDIEFSVFPR